MPAAEKPPTPHVQDIVSDASEDVLATFFTTQKETQSKAVPAKPAPKAPEEEPVATLDEEGNPVEAPAEQEGEETQVAAEEPQAEEAPQLPEGMVAVPAVTDKPVTEFVVRDETGELEIPALTVEYKANGKVRRDRLDQVVKMAQQGVYNVEREQNLRQREEQLATGSQETKETLKLREQQLEALLQDPDRYEAARERWLAANSPDQQVERLRAQLRERDTEAAQARASVAAQTFLQQEVVPALATIAQNLPEVSEEELSQQLAVGMYPFMVNGVVPVERYGDIRRYIVEHLTQWARETHESRVTRFGAAKKKADTEVRKAQVASQQAKSTVAKVTKPVGRAAPPNASKAPAKVNPSVDEALDDAMNEAMRGLALTD